MLQAIHDPTGITLMDINNSADQSAIMTFFSTDTREPVMAKSTKQTPNTNDPAALGQAFLKQFEDAGLGSMNWMGTNWFEAMAEMNSEVMSFIAARISEDAKTQQELLQCKSAEELQKAQLAFLEKAQEQYKNETGKLVKMGLDMLPNAGKGTKHTPV
jgi:hypothetical protein